MFARLYSIATHRNIEVTLCAGLSFHQLLMFYMKTILIFIPLTHLQRVQNLKIKYSKSTNTEAQPNLKHNI